MGVRRKSYSFQYLEFGSIETFNEFLDRYEFNPIPGMFQGAWKFSSKDGVILYIGRNPITGLRVSDGEKYYGDAEPGYAGLVEIAIPPKLKYGTEIIKTLLGFPRKGSPTGGFNEGAYYTPRIKPKKPEFDTSDDEEISE